MTGATMNAMKMEIQTTMTNNDDSELCRQFEHKNPGGGSMSFSRDFRTSHSPREKEGIGCIHTLSQSNERYVLANKIGLNERICESTKWVWRMNLKLSSLE